MEPKVLLDDDNFIAFYKPPYYIMDTSTNYEKKSETDIEKQWKSKRKPFLMFIKNYLNNINIYPNNESYNVCQRLDINTSGIVLTAKNIDWNECRSIINDKKNVIKLYVCLVNGYIKQNNGFIINNIKCKTNPFTYCKTLSYNPKFYGSKSCSYYQILKRLQYQNKQYTLVLVRIFTGRTHQIRVHMKSLGHSIVSDDRYTNKKIKKDNIKIIKRMFLHNIVLKFKYDNKDYNILCELPSDLKNALKKMTILKQYPIDKHFLTMQCDF